MGAKYAPSVANLVLAKWEEEKIYHWWPEMSLYKRYIDYILLIWEGPQDGLINFLKQLNNSEYGLSFTGEWSMDQIHFLDLFRMEGKIYTKTYFKDTDHNSYISMTSCHHHRWIYNTQSSQFTRIRRNCVVDSDYCI